MSEILVRSESRYPVDRKKIREKIAKFLAEKKIIGKVEVSVVIVGDRKMKALNQKYREIKKTTPVLAFPLENTERSSLDRRFPLPFSSPDNVLRLGDIVVSFPEAVKLAAQEEKLVDDKINELVEHGMKKLLGA